MRFMYPMRAAREIIPAFQDRHMNQPLSANPTSIALDTAAAERVRASFKRQNAMALIQASLGELGHGRSEIHLPHWEGVEQQHGFVHGGVVGMIADSAAGYAAM